MYTSKSNSGRRPGFHFSDFHSGSCKPGTILLVRVNNAGEYYVTSSYSAKSFERIQHRQRGQYSSVTSDDNVVFRIRLKRHLFINC